MGAEATRDRVHTYMQSVLVHTRKHKRANVIEYGLCVRKSRQGYLSHHAHSDSDVLADGSSNCKHQMQSQQITCDLFYYNTHAYATYESKSPQRSANVAVSLLVTLIFVVILSRACCVLLSLSICVGSLRYRFCKPPCILGNASCSLSIIERANESSFAGNCEGIHVQLDRARSAMFSHVKTHKRTWPANILNAIPRALSSCNFVSL